MTSLTAHGICNAIGGKLGSAAPLTGSLPEACAQTAAPCRPMPFSSRWEEKSLTATCLPRRHPAPRRQSSSAAWRKGWDPSCAVILVEDTLKALQQLASWWRAGLTLTAIGLTGSNGKTSTKDLTASVLSQGLRTIATQGNLNNHIGVPLSILRASRPDEAAVWEMGMNHPGELAPCVK